MFRNFGLLFFFFSLLQSVAVKAQNLPDSFRVVTWNLEWWGAGSSTNAGLQVSKTETLLTTINADFYGFQEIVNIDSFANLVNRLPGGPWESVVSSYGSTAPNPQSPNYPSAQKLAFMYRPSQFRNVRSRAFINGHPYAYGDFASGRYPMLVEGELKCSDHSWRPMAFIVLHAKAMSDNSSCNRREEGAYLLKDSLDRKFRGKDFLILGDFNDDLDTSICNDRTFGAYYNFVRDSVGPYSYNCLTLPISLAGERSSDHYSSLIDHFIASRPFARYYVGESARSLRPLANATVTSYTSDVSDHYPVQTTFYRPASALSVENPFQNETLYAVFPNPVQSRLQVKGLSALAAFGVIDLSGRTVLAGVLEAAQPTLSVENLSPGTYLLQLSVPNAPAQWLRFVKE